MEFSMQDIGPLIAETVASGGTFRLYPKGKSMYPVIDEATDSVLLGAPADIRKYDAVLFRRKSGTYVLHRVIKIHGGLYDMCGDNQLAPERDVPADRLIAKTVGVYKGETFVPSDDAGYLRTVKRIHRARAIKYFFFRVKGFLRRRLFGKTA